MHFAVLFDLRQLQRLFLRGVERHRCWQAVGLLRVFGGVDQRVRAVGGRDLAYFQIAQFIRNDRLRLAMDAGEQRLLGLLADLRAFAGFQIGLLRDRHQAELLVKLCHLARHHYRYDIARTEQAGNTGGE